MGIYERQKELDLKIPQSVGIIGVGGVGSWVAINLALVGVQKVIIVDHDIVEEHNLNRTLFKIDQIGKSKVESIAELIYERRRDIEVIPIQKKLEDLNELELELLKDCEVIVDCRDTTNPLPEFLQSKQKITAGYDGFNVTIHINPKYSTIWGEERVTYTVTPSFLVPPQFLACIITLYIVCPVHKVKEKIKTFDIREIFSILGL